MKTLLTKMVTEITERRDAMLCTVVSGSGSSPRGAGAKMLVCEDGSTFGSIGGGAVEHQAIRRSMELLAAEDLPNWERSRMERFGLSPGGAGDTGMICGGEIQVYFQHLTPRFLISLRAMRRALRLLDAPGPSWLVTCIEDPSTMEEDDPWRFPWHFGTYDPENGLRMQERKLTPEEEELLKGMLGKEPALRVGQPTLYVEPLNRGETAYLFGAGHVAQALARILDMAEFRVVVYDQREALLSKANFRTAAGRICGPFQEAAERVGAITAEDYVIIMTPGHQADYEVLAQALRTPAKYIGCIGSRKKAAATRARLLADGFTEAEIARIHSPIGLPIGGETPGEIAVSVAAQLIACRSGRLEDFS